MDRETLEDHCLYDLCIIGGGLAGLTLALQLLQRRPASNVVVLDKRPLPLSDAVGKVGESSVEVGAHYLRHTLGLESHLKGEQLPKLGVRYFFDAEPQTPIAQRLEMGSNHFPHTPSFQLDRGRLENHLISCVREAGGEVIESATVCDFELHRNAPHRITWRTSAKGERGTLHSTWLVDASGRTALLKKRKKLSEPMRHCGTSVWWRMQGEHRIDEWSQDAQWRSRNGESNPRWLSTNHLTGRGYWVWIIPLSSRCTSFGIVADPRIHPFSSFSRFESALEWLKVYEPECARVVEAHRDQLLDFQGLKNYPLSTTQVFSSDRWACTGEAGLFLDPFYSPGTDFIGVANTHIVDLVLRDLEGEDIKRRSRLLDILYRQLAEATLETFRDQYSLMGNPLVMPLKIFWDWCYYWSFLGRLFFERRFEDSDHLSRLSPLLQRFRTLSTEVQELFREWDTLERPQAQSGFIDLRKFPYLLQLNEGLLDDHWGDRFDQRFEESLEHLEQVAGLLARLLHSRTGHTPALSCARAGECAATDAFLSFYNEVVMHTYSVSSNSCEDLSQCLVESA